MKIQINLSVDPDVYDDFKRFLPKTNISQLVENVLQEEIDKKRLAFFFECSKCKTRTHVNLLLNNGGKCQFIECKEQLLHSNIKEV